MLCDLKRVEGAQCICGVRKEVYELTLQEVNYTERKYLCKDCLDDLRDALKR